MRVAVAWPKPRGQSFRLGQTLPDEYPDQSDALLLLEEFGIDVALEDSLRVPLNPLVHMHHFYSGLDPVRAVRILARRRKYDAVVCVGDSPAFFLARLRDALAVACPIVLIDPGLSGGYARRKRLLDDLLPRMNRVVVFGRVQLDYLHQEYGSRVAATFLHHRIDTDFYRPASSGAAPGEKLVFSVGNDAFRDFATLEQAARVCLQEPARQLRFMVQTRLPVETAGALHVGRDTISYVELRDAYAQAAVVALPLVASRHAGGINTLLEAMAMGRPIVVSASPGILDYVQHQETALAVPCGDPEALAAAIKRLIDSPEEAARLGAAARKFVVEHCANRTYARELARVIEGAIQQQAR